MGSDREIMLCDWPGPDSVVPDTRDMPSICTRDTLEYSEDPSEIEMQK